MCNRLIHILFVILVLLMMSIPKIVSAQSSASVSWTMHRAYNDVQQVLLADDAVYVLSAGMIYSVDKTTETRHFYTLLDGLWGGSIARMAYDSIRDEVLLFYEDGMVDYLHDGQFSGRVKDLYLKETTLGKMVQQTWQENDLLYLAMPYGIQTYRLTDRTFQNTFFIGDEAAAWCVRSLCMIGDTLYAATDSVVMKAARNSNLVDYRVWQPMPVVANMQPKGVSPLPIHTADSSLNTAESSLHADSALLSKSSNLIALWGNRLYRWNGGEWTAIHSEESFAQLAFDGGKAIAIGADSSFCEILEDTLLRYASSYPVADAVFDASASDYWCASNQAGLIHIMASGETTYAICSPVVNSPYRMRYSGDALYVVNGGRWAVQHKNAPYVMVYDGDSWTNYVPEKLQSQGIKMLDPMSVVADTADPSHYWLATYGTGLFEMQGDSIVHHYHARNSGLESATYNDQHWELYTRTDGLLRMEDGSLFVMNASIGPKVLKDTVWTTLQIFDTYGMLCPFHTPDQPIHDTARNRIWLPTCRLQAGLACLDYGSSVVDTADNRSLFRSDFIGEDGQMISLDMLYGSGLDKDGNVWLCCQNGLYYFSANDDFYQTNVLHRLGAIGGFSEWFMKDSRANCLVADSANRKWLGTDALGVYVISADNSCIEAHYTMDNSPLPSNSILSIAVHPTTNEVMIGSAAGIVSYRELADQSALPEQATALDTYQTEKNTDEKAFPNDPSAAQKIWKDGRLLILRDGRLYDMLGRIVQ